MAIQQAYREVGRASWLLSAGLDGFEILFVEKAYLAAPWVCRWRSARQTRPERTPRARASRRSPGGRRFILSESLRKGMLICRNIPADQRFNILLSLSSFPCASWLLSRRELVVSRFDGYLASFGNVSAPWASLKILSWSGWLFARLLKFWHFGLSPKNKLTLR